VSPTLQHPRVNALGILVDALDMHTALSRVHQLLRGKSNAYICVAGVHGVMEAHRNADLFRVYRDAAVTVPDGMPLVWLGRMQGHANMERVAGPDLMLEIFRNPQFAGVRHFLYGGDIGVAEELKTNLQARFPWTNIVGTFTPPFRELDKGEEQDVITTINSLSPNIVWIGIGCPRQELFMARYVQLLNTRLMIGVGAAFDYHTGRIRDAPDWVKHAGLQWFHRLMQDPRRLWRRYLRNNPAFLWHIGRQMISDLRREPVETARRAQRAVERRRQLHVR